MNTSTWRDRMRTRQLEAAALLGGMALLTGALGAVFAGWTGFVWSLGLSLVLLYVGVRGSAVWALRWWGARALSRNQAPSLHRLMEALSRRAGLASAPGLYLLPAPVPQALAVGTGRHAALAVTPALLEVLSRRELAGVLAHEMSHIRYGDVRLMTAARAFGQLARVLSSLGTLLLVTSLILLAAGQPHVPLLAVLVLWSAPPVMDLLTLALSRSREYAADLEAARLTGDPRGLASALSRIEALRHRPPWWSLFLPRAARPRQPEPDPWLTTHPPSRERVRRLLELEARTESPGGSPPLRADPFAPMGAAGLHRNDADGRAGGSYSGGAWMAPRQVRAGSPRWPREIRYRP